MEAALTSKVCAIHYQIYPGQYTSNHSHTTAIIKYTNTLQVDLFGLSFRVACRPQRSYDCLEHPCSLVIIETSTRTLHGFALIVKSSRPLNTQNWKNPTQHSFSLSSHILYIQMRTEPQHRSHSLDCDVMHLNATSP